MQTNVVCFSVQLVTSKQSSHTSLGKLTIRFLLLTINHVIFVISNYLDKPQSRRSQVQQLKNKIKFVQYKSELELKTVIL